MTFGLHDECTPTTVDIERFVMIDESTFPIINVALYKGKYSEKDYSGYVKGDYTYFVDVYTGAASTGAEGGDQIATLNLQRMIGVIRAILEDTRYKTLGFDNLGVLGVQNAHADNFYINLPRNTGNAADLICGRLVYNVACNENVQLGEAVPGVPPGGTTVKINNTSKGYFWGVE